MCRAFKEVAQLIFAKAATIEKKTCILFWHHIMVNLFNYLAFKPL